MTITMIIALKFQYRSSNLNFDYRDLESFLGSEGKAMNETDSQQQSQEERLNEKLLRGLKKVGG